MESVLQVPSLSLSVSLQKSHTRYHQSSSHVGSGIVDTCTLGSAVYIHERLTEVQKTIFLHYSHKRTTLVLVLAQVEESDCEIISPYFEIIFPHFNIRLLENQKILKKIEGIEEGVEGSTAMIADRKEMNTRKLTEHKHKYNF